jgi:hypothetical protein
MMADGVNIDVDNESAQQVGNTIGQGFISSVVENLPPLMTQIFGGMLNADALKDFTSAAATVSGILKESGNGLAQVIEKSGSDFGKGVDEIFKKATGKDFTMRALVDVDPANFLSKLESLGKEGARALAKQLGLKEGDFEGTFTALKKVFEHVKDIASPLTQKEVIIEFALGAGINVGLETLKKSIVSLEEPILSVNRAAAGIAAPFIDLDGTGIRTLSKAIHEYRVRINEAVKETGLSREEFTKLETGFVGAGVAAENLNISLSIGFGDNASKDLRGIAAAATAFRGAGIDGADGAKELSFAMRNLGLSAQESFERLGIMTEIAGKSGESILKVRETINSGATSLKYFGDTTNSVAQIYDKFLRTVGEGREGLAAEFVDTIVKGIGGMNEGLKAFIGQVSGIGGGQGAIGGMLDTKCYGRSGSAN